MKYYKFIRQCSLVLFLLTFLGLTHAIAQDLNTKISGKIVNESAEGLIGASVAIRNTSTGFYTGTATGVDGTYSVRELPLGGPYTVEITYTGYQPVKQTGINLDLGDQLTFDFTLVEGTELETVVVTADNLKGRTDRMGSAVAITGKTLSTIPTPTRNFEQLSSIAPTGYVADVGSRNFGGAGVGGVKGGQTGYTVDGGNTRRMVFGGSLDGPAFTISQEAIREFEISTNDYDVKNGRNLGGNISAVTKSGTNELHGSAWYYRGGGEGPLTQDKSFTGDQLSQTPTQDQYGLSIGGPIIKDKLFFFGVFDRFKTSPVANPFEVGFLDFNNQVFGSVADAESFYGMTESEAQAILDAGSAKGYDVGELGPLLRSVQTQNIFFKLDYNINDKHRASLRYSWLDYFQTNDNSSNNAHGFANVIPNSGNLYGTNASNYLFETTDTKIIGSLRSQFTNKILNNFKLQFVNTLRSNAPNDAEQETRVFVGASNGAIAFGQNTWVPEVVESQSIQIIDDVTIDAGAVTYTFGMNHQFYNQSERLPHYTAPSVIYDNVED
ncbi:MAG: carboxypeptidase-like regulatory domain-containing protein, partial [Bacteroidota bacterium]